MTVAQSPIGLCLDCGYPLQGLPTPRCPECGRDFDPLDTRTMNMGRELSPVMRWILGPMRWPVTFAMWAVLAFSLWTARLPGGQFAGSSSIVILSALALFWLTWPVVRLIVARRYGWPVSLLMRGQKQRIIVGLALLLASGAILSDFPLRAALWISRPAMDRMAKELIASGQPFAKDQWVGVFPATRVKITPGGVHFTTEREARVYRSGFVYLPDVDPKRVGWSKRNYRPVGGGWWAWREEG